MTTDNSSLDDKYRPKTLDEVIGHTDAVGRLRGMLATKKLPGAFLFTGDTSVGKTTLARVLAAEINGKPIEKQGQDYQELNGGATRSIEEMRDLIKISKFRPTNRRRIIVIDEAQQILSNNIAAQALLKPIEDAGNTSTIWVLCSMSPEKFGSGTGRAIANRCAQFALKPPSDDDLFKQASRIRKGEGMQYMTRDAVNAVVAASNKEMRTIAHLMKAVQDTYEGMKTKPKEIDAKAVGEVISHAESQDNDVVVQVIVALLSGKYGKVHRALLDVAEPFPFVNKLLWAAQFQLNVAVLNGERHPKVWWNDVNKKISAALKEVKPSLGLLGALNETLVLLKQQSMTFAVGEIELMSAVFYRFIKDNLTKKE